MGNQTSTSSTSGNKQNGSPATGEPQAGISRTKYRNSLRRKRRAPSSVTTVDTRDVKVSRGCVRPLVTRGTQWEDPVFPREMALEGINVNCRWMRPKEFCENPTLVNDLPSRHDVVQGSIGNCWVMATLAGIADNHRALLKILANPSYDPQSSDYDGVFHCRFWHYGQWVDIYVDDCLPVRVNPGAPNGFSLVGAHSPDHNVLWVALVEKALAKFHGSYKAIEAREREYGWRLLTGGVPGILDQDRVQRMPSDHLYERIRSAVEQGNIVTCSRLTENNRLHAFTVTGVRRHAQKGNIIRIRNPWGEDNSVRFWQKPEAWTYAEDEEKDDFTCKDGEFWVMRGECYREFKQFCIGCFKADYYDDINRSSTILKHKYSYYGEWKEEKAAGCERAHIFSNPKYQIRVKGSRGKTKKILFELIPRPVDRTKGICLYLYKITKVQKSVLCQEVFGKGSDGKHTFLANGSPQHKYDLPSGRYLVIPITKDSKDEREFCLRIFSNSGITCRSISGVFFHQPATQVLPATARIPVSSTNSSTEASGAEKDAMSYHGGLWRRSMYINQENLSSLLDTVTQYHLKVSCDCKLTVTLYQELKSDRDSAGIQLYKIEDSTTLPLNKDYLDKKRAHPEPTPLKFTGPAGTSHYNLTPTDGQSYVLLVFPWSDSNSRHYVTSLSTDKTAKLQCKLIPPAPQ